MKYTRPMESEAPSTILRLVREWEIPVSIEMVERIDAYLHLLLRWNERVNLTGAHSIRELVEEHLPDSLALAKLTPNGSSVVDIGSGGGLPAVPFAILRPDCRVTLVEPRAKRVAFLNTAVRACECRLVEVARRRLEETTDSKFSVATSRATFSPEDWLSLACRLLCEGGLAVVFARDCVATGTTSAKLLNTIEYHTVNGAPRWSGAFRFT
jgi:16S rRNA (guanine527-N7)-methyltransferase